MAQRFRYLPIGDSLTRFPNGQPPIVVAGTSYVALPGGYADVPGNSSISPPTPVGWFCIGQVGATADRPNIDGIGTNLGLPYVNTQSGAVEFWDGKTWRTASGSAA